MIAPVLAGLFVLVAPGAALLLWLPRRFDPPGASRRDPLAFLTDSIALSVALTALGGMLSLFVGVRYSLGGLWVLYGLIGAVLVAGAAWKVLRGGFRPSATQATGAVIVPLVIVLIFLLWRFYQMRDLVLPAWVDSVHHTLIVRKMMEWGGVPWDLRPYIDVPFYYHYGFHLVTALFSTLSGLSAAQGVLWLGQVTNALVALSVYRLGMAFTESGQKPSLAVTRARALLAALLVNFALQMPAYYLTWGRYTLLTGLLLLGPAMAAAYETRRSPFDRGAWIRYIVLVAGIFTTHYLVVLLMAFFLIVLGLSGLWRWAAQRNARAFPWALVTGGLLAVALAAPWLWRIFEYAVIYAGVQVVGVEGGGSNNSREYIQYLIFLAGPRHNYYLMALAGLGLLFSLWRAELRLLAAWAVLLVIQSLPWGLRIQPFRPDLYVIVLFFPAALLIAELLVSAAQAYGRLNRGRLGVVLAGLTALLLLGWGAWQTRSVLNPATIFVTRDDVVALDWIARSTPPEARFYTNAAAWQNVLFRGVDGGYWLMPYTGRASLVPPVLYGLGSAESIYATGDLLRRTERVAGCSLDFWRLVRDAALTHVYLREGTGKLQPSMLANCSRLREIYASGGVHIYEIQQP